MKNLIFSIWSTSLTPNWIQYKSQLIDKQRAYADQCNVDYRHFDISLTFTELMFFKIQFAEHLLNEYDQVLYLDVDVIPLTNKSFFETFNLDNICLHYTLNPKWKIQQKKLMLAQEGITSNDKITNTGVFGMNRTARDTLNYTKKRSEIKKLYGDYKPNNEVYMSYILEKYKIPYTEIGMQWNYILDNNVQQFSAGCYFVHQVNKNFKDILNK